MSWGVIEEPIQWLTTPSLVLPIAMLLTIWAGIGYYSVIFLAHGSDEAIQDDTFVKTAHRGHKLGLALKVATLAAVQRDHPERTSIHTWTDPSNDVMQRINKQFGFRKIELMHEVQRTDRW